MTTESICQKDHPFATSHLEWEGVPYSQAHHWRHRCAACAYEQGYRDAMAEALSAVSSMFERELRALLP